MKKSTLFLLFFIIAYPLYAKQITLEFLNSKPKSIYKDYYIWRYLDQNISSKSAFDLIGSVKNMNMKLFLKFCSKIDIPIYKKIKKCYKMSPKQFVHSDADCIRIGFSVYDATKLSKNELKKIQNRIKKLYPNLSDALKIVSSKDPFTALLKSRYQTFFAVFNHVGSKYREKYFNKIIPKEIVKNLSRSKAFNKTVKLIVTNPRLKNLQKSLIDINSSSLSDKSNFFLAMNALKKGKTKKALRYLDIADKKFYYRFDKDKVLFWKYLITKKPIYLSKLSKSFHPDIYTLFAYQKTGKRDYEIVSNLKCENQKSSKNIYDPFFWLKTLNKLNKKDSNITNIADSFQKCEELPFKAFALERINYTQKSYFIRPYKKYLQDFDIYKQILILSTARQESRFIPACISSSYALGMMQFMPFLAKATAKLLKIKDFDIDEMFIPKIAYKFADLHIGYLEKRLKNPLFIAYAYNGGIGFTLRMLKKGFFKRGDYEPFLSMELVPYDESRRYGKKVLENYIIYSEIYGKKVDINTLFQNLIRP